MEREALFRRLEDLRSRSEKGIVTHSWFLTEEEQAAVRQWSRRCPDSPVFFGGREGLERKMVFFFPEWETERETLMAEELCCVKLTGELSGLSHRDYLGAVLGLGLNREAIGDILPGQKATYVYCTSAAAGCMERTLSKVGRQNVSVELVPLGEAVLPEKQVEEVTFTVKSLRLDAGAAGLFHISRTEAVERIERGECQVNHTVCMKPDAQLKEGDVLSLRGLGKGEIARIGGQSKKGRLFVTGERWK